MAETMLQAWCLFNPDGSVKIAMPSLAQALPSYGDVDKVWTQIPWPEWATMDGLGVLVNLYKTPTVRRADALARHARLPDARVHVTEFRNPKDISTDLHRTVQGRQGSGAVCALVPVINVDASQVQAATIPDCLTWDKRNMTGVIDKERVLDGKSIAITQRGFVECMVGIHHETGTCDKPRITSIERSGSWPNPMLISDLPTPLMPRVHLEAAIEAAQARCNLERTTRHAKEYDFKVYDAMPSCKLHSPDSYIDALSSHIAEYGRVEWTHCDTFWHSRWNCTIRAYNELGGSWDFGLGDSVFGAKGIQSAGWFSACHTDQQAFLEPTLEMLRGATGGTGIMVVLAPAVKEAYAGLMEMNPKQDTFIISGMGNRADLYRSWADLGLRCGMDVELIESGIRFERGQPEPEHQPDGFGL